MKRGFVILIAALFCFTILSCKKSEEAILEQKEPEMMEPDSKNEEKVQEDEIIGRFLFQYGTVHESISLDDCKLEYEKNGTAVYSKYMDSMGYSGYENFPDSRYLLYAVNPHGNLLLFPIINFQICEDTDTVYMVYERIEDEKAQESGKGTGEGLIDTASKKREDVVLQKLVLHREDSLLQKEDLADGILVERMMVDAYQISENKETDSGGAEPLFSDVHFTFEDQEKNSETMKTYGGWEEQHKRNTLAVYASGIEKATGKKYYIDFKWDDLAGKEIVSPCILPKYDAKKDSEAFEKCQQAFERIMQGDWSDVAPVEGLEYMWRMDGADWRQEDVNKDGMPELVCQEGSGDRTAHKKPINLIFAWNGERVDLIYVDLIDGMEFLFLTDEGKLLHEWGTSGIPKRTQFTQYHFDEKRNLVFEEALLLFYFWGEDTYSGEIAEYYKDRYPSTFGTYGGGLYYQQIRPKTEEELAKSSNSYTVKEDISNSQFQEKYYEMTGQEFMEDNALFWEEEFNNAISE